MKSILPFPIYVFLLSLVVALIIMVFKAHQEAEVWNRFRGADQPAATWWDALFVDFRVEARQ